MTNREFEQRVKAIEKSGPSLSVDERNREIERICDAYIVANGEAPPSKYLERLANVILHEDLTDKTKKAKNKTRPPIYTEQQLDRPMTARRSQRAETFYGAEGLANT